MINEEKETPPEETPAEPLEETEPGVEAPKEGEEEGA